MTVKCEDPVRARGRPSKSETPTPDDLLTSPYDDPMLAAEQEEMYEWMAALPDFTADKGVSKAKRKSKR